MSYSSQNKDKSRGPRRLGNCLPDHLARALSRHIDEDMRLRQAWHAAVPEPLASHARPVRYTNGLLFIHVDTPAWASRLRHQQPALIKSLRKMPLFCALANIRARVVPPESNNPISMSSLATPSRLSPVAAKVVAQTASTINDPNLRAALERLARAGEGAPGHKRFS